MTVSWDVEARQPGLYPAVDELIYHADRASLSVSGAKLLIGKSPAHFQWERAHRTEKRAFDFGHAAHHKVLGVGLPIEIVQVTVTDKKTGEVLDQYDAENYLTNSAKEHRDAIYARGHVPLLRREARQVDDMAEKLLDHRLALELLTAPGEDELSAYAVDEPTGIMRRGRFDRFCEQVTVDYKSAVSADPEQFAAAAARNGYHMQDAWYRDLRRDLGRPDEAFVFVVQEKDAPYAVSVVELDKQAEDRGRALNRRALDIYADCISSGTWPAYLPADAETPALISLPRWALFDRDDIASTTTPAAGIPADFEWSINDYSD